VWNDLVILEERMPEYFAGLVKDVVANLAKWAAVAGSTAPHNEELPSPWNTKVGT
jgi:hypothetical protein